MPRTGWLGCDDLHRFRLSVADVSGTQQLVQDDGAQRAETEAVEGQGQKSTFASTQILPPITAMRPKRYISIRPAR
jgi:hypothetical protein